MYTYLRVNIAEGVGDLFTYHSHDSDIYKRKIRTQMYVTTLLVT